MSPTDSRLIPFVPRLLLEWEKDHRGAPFRNIPGTMVFVDISGFTAMSERLARKGKEGAEEVTDVLDSNFTQFLSVAWEEGGSLLKFGGDALLLFFAGEGDAVRGTRAAARMRKVLRERGPLKTSAGQVKLKMSVGVHTGPFHFFLAGESHRELVVTGPETTETVLMESAADAGQILLSPSTARELHPRCLGPAKGGGVLLKSMPERVPFAGFDDPLPNIPDIAKFIPLSIREQVEAEVHEAEHRQVTLAFIHFDGTDSLIEQAGPTSMQRLLDDMIRAIQEAVSDHRICFLATDIDRDGGKVILVAGAPQTPGQNDQRMMRAVRSIADAECALALRIGVTRGHVFAGAVGAPFRRTYTVMGDAVNLAARLMARAGPGEILATPAVLERSRTVFETTELEPFLVKGKTKPVLAVQVGRITGSRGARQRRRLPFVGREHELEALSGALTSAQERRGSLVEIVGEGGMGKSRLVEELHQIAGEFRIVSATCEPYESSTPYFPFRRLLRSVLDVALPEDGADATDQISDRLSETAPELIPWIPLLAIPLDVTVRSTREFEELQQEFWRPRLHSAVRELLDKVLPQPALLILEDAHWIDEASNELLGYLVDHVADMPWLVCVTRRQDAGGFSPSQGMQRTTVQLTPLSLEASASLIRAAADLAAFPHQRVAALAERAGGNPLFLQELIAEAGTDLGEQVLPESVEAVIAARMDKLTASDRRLLRYASVLGASFSLDLLNEILGPDFSVAEDRSAWSRVMEFLDQDDGNLRFRQALLRDVAYESLPFRTRRNLHQQVGEGYERRYGDRVHEFAELLSLHFHRAQIYDKAWRYSLAAGHRAKEKYANIEAAEFYRRALESSRRLSELSPAHVAQVWKDLGDVSELAGLYRDAGTAYRNARLMSPSEPWAQGGLLLREGVIREREGRYSHALRWYTRGLRSVATAPDEQSAIYDRIQLGLAYAGVRARQGRFKECIRWCNQVVRDAEEIGDREGLAHAYYLLHISFTQLGHPERERYRELALPIYEDLEDLLGQANVLNNLGIEAYWEARWDEALGFYERSKVARERIGDVIGAATISNNIGEIKSDQGHLSEAVRLFEEAYLISRGAGYRVLSILSRSNLGRAAARAGRLDEAKAMLHEALEGFREIRAESHVIETEARLAERAVFSANPEEALTLSNTALERSTPSSTTAALLQRVRGYARLQQRDLDQALERFDESLRIGRAIRAEYEVGLTLEAILRLNYMTGRHEREDMAAERRSIYERLGVVSTPAVPLAELTHAPISDPSK